MDAVECLKYPISSPRHPTPQELGHSRPWRVVECKFCGCSMETRAKWNFVCKECKRVNWIAQRRGR